MYVYIFIYIYIYIYIYIHVCSAPGNRCPLAASPGLSKRIVDVEQGNAVELSKGMLLS